jgi:A/G-specific adenine glycosylase
MAETSSPRHRRAIGKSKRAAPRREGKDAPARRLLAWYDGARRRLPWRAEPGETADPYRVWLSEIMLQQTTVPAAIPYFRRFVRCWPDVASLAAAPLDAVLAEWQGLGYYARARNLHRAAKTVANDLGGRFPETEEGLRRLPGVGPYTAAAIAAIAFGRKAAAVDANAERVLARLFAVREPLPEAKERLRELARGLVPQQRSGDFAQAMMDLGAGICTPRAPRCGLCPLSHRCLAHGQGIAERLPARRAKAPRPTRHGVAFYLERPDGALWLRRRPERGLLGGMIEVPSSPWRAHAFDAAEARAAAPLGARWRALPGQVRHTFTHFHLELTVLAARVGAERAAGLPGIWAGLDRLGELALPTVMKKVIRHARAALA